MLRDLSAAVAPIAASYGVERLYLFGSRARGDARPDSDYDFMITKGKVRTLFLHAALCQALEDALHASVDLITDTSSDQALIERARKDAVLLYDREGSEYHSENASFTVNRLRQLTVSFMKIKLCFSMKQRVLSIETRSLCRFSRLGSWQRVYRRNSEAPAKQFRGAP